MTPSIPAVLPQSPDLLPHDAAGRRERLLVGLFCLLAAVRVFLFTAAFPFFTCIDEQYHFDVVCRYSHGNVPSGPQPFSVEAADLIALYGQPGVHSGPRRFAGGESGSAGLGFFGGGASPAFPQANRNLEEQGELRSRPATPLLRAGSRVGPPWEMVGIKGRQPPLLAADSSTFPCISCSFGCRTCWRKNSFQPPGLCISESLVCWSFSRRTFFTLSTMTSSRPRW